MMFQLYKPFQHTTIRAIFGIVARNTSSVDMRTCTLIPGDGIGPELTSSLRKLFKACEVPIEFEEITYSELHENLKTNVDDVVRSVRRNKLCIKGSVTYSRKPGKVSENTKFRKDLDIYALAVHARTIPGISTRHKNVDVVVIREQMEGEYSALEHMSVPGIVESLKIITEKNSMRIAKFAFDFATKYNRKKVTAVHKANIMKVADGLFLRCCEEMAELYPRIKFEKMIVDNTTMQIVGRPDQFDVMVTPNLYGNIICNIAAGLVGGAGVVDGISYSNDVIVCEPGARHAFEAAMGKNIANPTAMFLCGARLLEHLHMYKYVKQIRKAVFNVIKDGKVLTKDIGGEATTDEFTDCVIANL